MRASCRFGVAIAIVLLACRFSAADVSAKANAYTEHDRFREQMERNRKTILEAYREVGNKNAAWDAEAIKFLEAAVQYFGGSGFGPLVSANPPKREALIELAEPAIKKGC